MLQSRISTHRFYRAGHLLCTTSRTLTCFCIFFSIVNAHSNGFDDSILFRLTWPGSVMTSLAEENYLIMTTLNDEKYHCILPADGGGSQEENKDYQGPSALELLEPLFSQLSCSYRFEQYWTYELCHGRYLKQYHEEREIGKKTHQHEYYLGRYDIGQFQENVAREKAEGTIHQNFQHIPTKKIDGQNLPYLEVTMQDGSVCDVTAQPRMTRVRYICYPESKHEIHSLDEISSCEYEVIVLSPHLCSHPNFRIKESLLSDIHCHPLHEAPARPNELQKQDKETMKFYQEMRKSFTEYMESTHGNLEKSPLEGALNRIAESTIKQSVMQKTGEQALPSDPKLIQDFLSGDYCLRGQFGWWNFEFCNGKHVDQYHESKDGSKASVSLGKWNIQKHLDWLEQNPHKKLKKGIDQRYVSHLYTDGQMCDLTARPRQVEVRFKCKESSSHPNAVSLVLMEPRVCEYILLVESSFMCPVLNTADENGIFQEKQINK